MNDSIYQLYRALVFDEPLLDNVSNLPIVASALSRRLLDGRCPCSTDDNISNNSNSNNNNDDVCYALSNRFINGVLYVCRQHRQQQQQQSTNNQSNSNVNYNNKVIAMSKLAFVCFIEIPWQCLKDAENNSDVDKTTTKLLQQLGRYLGSYQGQDRFIVNNNCINNVNPISSDHSDHFNNKDSSHKNITWNDADATTFTMGNEVTTQQQQQRQVQAQSDPNSDFQYDDDDHNNKKTFICCSSSNDHYQNAVMATQPTLPSAEQLSFNEQQHVEVWAAESDPSDYDFDEGHAAVSFGNNPNEQQQQQQNEIEEDWLDPKRLSQSSLLQTQDQTTTTTTTTTTLTLERAGRAISSLLQNASFSILEPLFSSATTQSELSHYTTTLTQLTLALLLQHPRTTTKDQQRLQDTTDGDHDAMVVDTLQQYLDDTSILAPLWVLRDAAWHYYHHTSTQSRFLQSTNQPQQHHNDLIVAYLQLLQTLLAVEEAQQQHSFRVPTVAKTYSGHHDDDNLCIASIVGLSALSAWSCMIVDNTRDRRCNNNDNNNKTNVMVTTTTIETVVDSMNDLAHILERSNATLHRYQQFQQQQQQQQQQLLARRHRLATAMTPLFEILSGIDHDRVRDVDYNNNNNSNHFDIPQTLLNSGLLRQVLTLVLATTTKVESASTSSACVPPLSKYHPIYHAIWGLCMLYFNIVGKYVFRFPGTIAMIRSSFGNFPCGIEDCVSCILWHAFLWNQMQGMDGPSTRTNQVIWKTNKQATPAAAATTTTTTSTKSFNAPTPAIFTPKECQVVIQEGWTRLCQLVLNAIELDSCCGDNKEKEGAVTSTAITTSALDTITEWKRLLVFVTKIPALSLTMKGLLDSSLLEDISTALSLQKGILPARDDLDNYNEGKRLGNDHDIHNETIKPRHHQRVLVWSMAHNVIKEYQLFFRGETTAATFGSSKND
jgi:hypothetical protein